MRFKIKYYDEKEALQTAQNHYCEWHDWFAWRPVRISKEEIAWLEKVERKADWVGTNTHWFLLYEPIDCQYRAKSKWKEWTDES